MKALLFDIDGTLIVTHKTGPRAFEAVLSEVFGVKQPNMEVKFGGRTDCALFKEVMRINEINPTPANFELFARAYRARFPRTLCESDGFVLPGVVELLSRLREHGNLHLAVMTGNLKETATQKLIHFGLRDYFDEIFGGDFDGDRRHLARRTALFLRVAHNHQTADGTIVIGDTPADIACGLYIDASVLAVCTGQYEQQILEAAGAHVVYEDLSEVDAVYRWLTE